MRSEQESQSQTLEGDEYANPPGQELNAPCRWPRASFKAGLCSEQGGGPASGHFSLNTPKSHSHCDKCKVR